MCNFEGVSYLHVWVFNETNFFAGTPFSTFSIHLELWYVLPIFFLCYFNITFPPLPIIYPSLLSCMSPFPPSSFPFLLLLFFPISPPPLQGEMMLYFSARPVVRASGQWNYSLPNPLNVSFNFHYFLIVTILLYIPCKSHFGVGNNLYIQNNIVIISHLPHPLGK